MNRACATIAALCAILLCANAQCKEDTKCRFRWCKPEGIQARITPRIFLRDEGFSTWPYVCLPMEMGDTILNKTVTVFKSGEAIIQPVVGRLETPPAPLPISRFRPRKMFPNFKKDHFFFSKVSASRPANLRNRYGIARKESRGNQEDFLINLCVTLPLISVGIEEADGTMTRVRGRGDPTSCVAFQSEIASILITLTWNTGDNFDLSVVDPNGNVVDKDNTPSVTGGALVNDQNVDMCELPTGREQIVWNKERDMMPVRGEYSVMVRHTTRCKRRVPTRWNLAVIVNGKNVLFRTGVSKRPRRIVLRDIFQFP